jgi:hypothetical protein
VSSLLTVGVFLLHELIFLLKNACHQCGSWTSRRKRFFKFLVQQEHAMNWIFLVTIVALSLIGVLYSHKIAGPLYNLQKFIQEHTFQKRIDRPLKFRERDFFPELTEDFNFFIKEYNPGFAKHTEEEGAA